MAELHVAPEGRDGDPGTRDRPFATIAGAQAAARRRGRAGKEPLTILVHDGTWYLDSPLTFGPGDSGTPGAPVTYAAAPGESVTLSGGRRLDCRWTAHRGRSARGSPTPVPVIRRPTRARSSPQAGFPTTRRIRTLDLTTT